MSCEEVRDLLPGLADEDESPLAVRRHLAGCVGCRVEAQRYSTMRAGLGTLRAAGATPPAPLLSSLEAIPEMGGRAAALRTHVARNKKAYVGGVALVAGAAGAALWRKHRAA